MKNLKSQKKTIINNTFDEQTNSKKKGNLIK